MFGSLWANRKRPQPVTPDYQDVTSNRRKKEKMIEELDAIQRLNLSRLLLDSIGLLLVGIVLEIGLHFGKKWALAKGQRRSDFLTFSRQILDGEEEVVVHE